MPIVGLIVVLCGIVLLLVSLPVAAGVVIAAAQWAWSSGFLGTLAVAAVVIGLIAWLDPRERRS